MSEPEFDASEFGREVAAALKISGWSYREAGRVLGIDQATLHRIAHGGKPDVENYVRLRHWMGPPIGSASPLSVETSEAVANRFQFLVPAASALIRQQAARIAQLEAALLMLIRENHACATVVCVDPEHCECRAEFLERTT